MDTDTGKMTRGHGERAAAHGPQREQRWSPPCGLRRPSPGHLGSGSRPPDLRGSTLLWLTLPSVWSLRPPSWAELESALLVCLLC